MIVASSNACRFFRADGQEIVFQGGEGPTVTDIHGNGYTDFVLGCGPVVLGHADPAFVQRLGAAVAGAIHLPGYTQAHNRLAESYVSLFDTPRMIGYFKHSSDAMTAAARLSANATGRLGVIRCGYLGWHDLLMGRTPAWHEPLVSPYRTAPRPTGPMRGIGADEPVFDWVDLRIETLEAELRAHPDRYGAFLFDAHQLSLTSPETVAQAVALCRSHGIPFTADETKTAGRVAPLGVLEQAGIEGDYIVLGKAIANGAPSSILIGPSDMQIGYGQAKISGTHCKELTGLYATEITKDIMEGEDGYRRLAGIGRRFVAAFDQGARAAGVHDALWAETIFGGSTFELRFSSELMERQADRQAMIRHLASHGILLMQGHPSFLCLAHETLDWARLSEQVAAGLGDWVATLDTPLGQKHLEELP